MEGSLRPESAVVRVLAALALALLIVPTAPAEDDVVARLSVTVDPDDQDRVHLPGPFAVAPGGGEVVLQVPVAEGVFLLSGSDILHHFPVPSDAGVRDLALSSEMMVAGAAPPEGRVTVDLFVFDYPGRRSIDRLRSANPFLRTAADDPGWHVSIGGKVVGVYHTESAATYPLWTRGRGIIPSTEQVGRAHAGIGFGDTRWIPHRDGSVERWTRGRTTPVAPAGSGLFIGGFEDGTAAMLASGPEPGELPEKIRLTLYRDGEPTGDVVLPAVGPSARGDSRLLRGPAVCVQGDRFYWLYLGYDYVEIRSRTRDRES